MPAALRELGQEGPTPGWSGDFSPRECLGRPSLRPGGWRGNSVPCSAVPKIGRLVATVTCLCLASFVFFCSVEKTPEDSRKQFRSTKCLNTSHPHAEIRGGQEEGDRKWVNWAKGSLQGDTRSCRWLPVPVGRLAFPSLCTACTEVTVCLPPAELCPSGRLRDYGVTVPCSTDFRGRFLSHVVSGPAAASAGSAAVDRPPAPPSHSGHLRVARSPLHHRGATPPPGPGRAGRYSLYFNVTVFGEELHLRLRPSRRLVVPGASAEWQEDFRELFRQPLQQECVYTGSVTGMPGAAVAISNCDGLVRDKPFLKPAFAPLPRCWLTPVPEPGRPGFLLSSPVCGAPVGRWCGLGMLLSAENPACPAGTSSMLCQVGIGPARMMPCLVQPLTIRHHIGTAAYLAGVCEPRHMQG